ncbi:hypothetical protein SCLCIDRAFT_1221943 [Scleroderma citrinum Foug A]|uniref:Uncharacterized protein n=1 Tax=Scleroderma citrinum Foug A TaxID=1036808 RepID=A0A0C3DDH5_9AGAM|nr:hypothetical protein SCLCIDRAFT_1221943 [Scleroderma citrinum Foug A]
MAACSHGLNALPSNGTYIPYRRPLPHLPPPPSSIASPTLLLSSIHASTSTREVPSKTRHLLLLVRNRHHPVRTLHHVPRRPSRLRTETREQRGYSCFGEVVEWTHGYGPPVIVLPHEGGRECERSNASTRENTSNVIKSCLSKARANALIHAKGASSWVALLRDVRVLRWSRYDRGEGYLIRRYRWWIVVVVAVNVHDAFELYIF